MLSFVKNIVCLLVCFFFFLIFRGIPTHRGWVKKIRFAPGKGNQKLLVMYTDGAEVWDTKEVSLSSPFVPAKLNTILIVD